MQTDLKKPAGIVHNPKLAWVWLLVTLTAISILTTFGPAEHSLGTHIRIVYLHAAWVWASLAALLAAGVCGLVGLLSGRAKPARWSQALGRSGLVFWVSYLPLSLIAMESNWNGLFLAEPRWRLALVFVITGILLQAGVSLADNLSLTSAVNLGYLIALIAALVQTPNVMHPSSPIFNSNAWRIQLYFISLTLLTILAAWQLARWWYKGETEHYRR